MRCPTCGFGRAKFHSSVMLCECIKCGYTSKEFGGAWKKRNLLMEATYGKDWKSKGIKEVSE